MDQLPNNPLPTLTGDDKAVDERMGRRGAIFLPESDVDFGRIRSAFAIALHMHQPLIPTGTAAPLVGPPPQTGREELRAAPIIGHLQHMFNRPGQGDNHNATVFYWCYRRMGDFLPELAAQGKSPRVMLDYSGCLLHGLQLMDAKELFDKLRKITCEPRYRRFVEWLGCPWGHAVAPSTPMQDYRLHVRAWQHHFASIFGVEALARVRGFSPAEMALPNHPDVAYQFVRILRECGFRWVLVQEHTVEQIDDGGRAVGIRQPHLPHRLVARNSAGEEASIIAIIKTQGSDTKLVAQMQPCYEARGLSRVQLAGKSVPPLVTQIADGENGGVMMNEFPGKYREAMAESTGSDTPAVNVTEYLEYLERIGVTEADFTPIQPIMQQRVWDRFKPGSGPEAMAQVIERLKRQDGRFHMEGGSWTNNISWVRGYEGLLGPIESASAMFAQKALNGNAPKDGPDYREALYHLLASQTSCFRYWGQGEWTDYGRELCRRLVEILDRPTFAAEPAPVNVK